MIGLCCLSVQTDKQHRRAAEQNLTRLRRRFSSIDRESIADHPCKTWSVQWQIIVMHTPVVTIILCLSSWPAEHEWSKQRAQLHGQYCWDISAKACKFRSSFMFVYRFCLTIVRSYMKAHQQQGFLIWHCNLLRTVRAWAVCCFQRFCLLFF